MRFYTTTIISPKQELTPEGFLLCRDVPIARIGIQLYAAGEVPIQALEGLIRIERRPEDVFAPPTIASFEAKPFTIDHPSEDVNPTNWSRLAKGTVQNVRRGTDAESDLLLADFLVTDAAAIAEVRNGVREVSCGYDADYIEIEPGYGLQVNIRGNHVALVEKGRCGSRCAIGDSQMKKTTASKWLDKIRAAFKSRDEAELEKTLTESPVTDESAEETEEEKKAREAKESGTADGEGSEEETEEEKAKRIAEENAKTSDGLALLSKALDAMSLRLDKLEGTRDGKKVGDEEEAEETEEQKKKREDEEAEKETSDKARDSAAVVEEVQSVLACAEILAPGLSLPTLDAAMSPDKVRDSLCQIRLKAVTAAFTGKHKDALTPFLGTNPDFAKLTCDTVALAFKGASEIVRRENNAGAQVTFDGAKNAQGVANQISTINRRNAEFWNRS